MLFQINNFIIVVINWISKRILRIFEVLKGVIRENIIFNAGDIYFYFHRIESVPRETVRVAFGGENTSELN